MFELRFKIKRYAWPYPLTTKFKGRMTTHVTFVVGKERTEDIVHIQHTDDHEFDAIIDFLKQDKMIYELDILYRDEKNLYIQIFTDVSPIGSLIGTINKHHSFIIKPIILKEGCEFWSVILPDKKYAPDLIEAVKKLGDFKLLSLKKVALNFSDMTEKQRLILDLAIELGYYEFPRKISAQDLAKRLKLGKATLLQHLRTAEAKVIKGSYW